MLRRLPAMAFAGCAVLALPAPDALATGVSVAITEPAATTVVTGVTTVTAAASAGVTRVDFGVDGVPVLSDTAAPFTFSWDTGRNPLPAPNHPIDYGYFLADGRYGDFRHEVNDYTNLYHAWARRGYEPPNSPPDEVWLPIMQRSLANAAAEGRRIQLNLNLQEETPNRVTPIDAVLAITAPYWDRVVRVELADEPGWDRFQTEQQAASVRAKFAAHGLAPKPLGVIYTRDQALQTDAIHANGLDFVMIEAYVDAPTASEDSQVNIDYLVRTVTAAKNRVPNDKQIGLVMQAYARNNAWRDIDTLRDLQVPTYLLAYNDPRVVALTMFSYGRESGTRQHRQLTTAHRLIGERILGRAMPRAGDGPRTLSVTAYDTVGNSATHRVTVHAQLARRGDFSGSPKADPATFDPNTGRWAVYDPASGPPLVFNWGIRGDIPIPGDFLADPKLDAVVYRPSAGTWIVQDPATGRALVHHWGVPGDVPLSGDYAGDARTDLVVFRPSTGTWFIKDTVTGAASSVGWGLPGDIPVAGDFLGDRQFDPAVFRPSTNSWYLLELNTGQVVIRSWGVPGDVPLAGDYLGDAHAELTSYRPSTGTWFLQDVATGATTAIGWGAPGDKPVVADYVGDNRADITVFRPSDATWHFRGLSALSWGQPGDLPVA